MIRSCLARNGGVVPVGLDDTLPGYDGNLWYDPLKRRASDLDDWMLKQNLLLVREAKTRHSTLRTVLRACEGEETVRKFPVTSLPDAGPDGVRMKLLTGMNALGKTSSSARASAPTDARRWKTRHTSSFGARRRQRQGGNCWSGSRCPARATRDWEHGAARSQSARRTDHHNPNPAQVRPDLASSYTLV